MNNQKTTTGPLPYLLASQHFTKSLPTNLQPKPVLFQPPANKTITEQNKRDL